MFPGDSTAFDTMSAVFPVFIGIVFVCIVGSIVYRAVRMANRGQNPLTLQEDLAHQVSRSAALAAPKTKADRLDELDRLRALGRISETELQEARTRILAE